MRKKVDKVNKVNKVNLMFFGEQGEQSEHRDFVENVTFCLFLILVDSFLLFYWVGWH